MWFKNLQIFSLPPGWTISPAKLEEALARHPLLPCPGAAMQSQGWVSPTETGELVYAQGRHRLIALGSEQRLLPAAVINQVAKEKIEVLTRQQGFAPGRKQVRDLKMQVADELRPRAFVRRRSTRAWLDLADARFIVDCATAKAAENLAAVLRADLGEFPAVPLESRDSPGATMTRWLGGGRRPGEFQLREDCELTTADQAKSAIRYVRHALEGPELRSLIGGGKTATRLGLLWRERLSFILDDKLCVKRLRFETMDSKDPQSLENKDEADAFDANFTLMTGELGELLKEVLATLGGPKPPR